ncbi:MAG: hypothetical protein K6L80_07820 [Agarilytica sp.]
MQNFFEKIEWSPTIGDPSIMGWLTVLAYFACALKSLKVYRASERIFNPPAKRQLRLWLGITVIMVALGINKQLDLQSFFTASARYFAWQQGWYERRQVFQEFFIVTIGLLGLAGMAALIVFYYRLIRLHALAIIGLISLGVFVLIRASSFHNVDAFLGAQWLGIKANWGFELMGIALVYINARQLLRKRRPIIDINITHSPKPAKTENA